MDTKNGSSYPKKDKRTKTKKLTENKKKIIELETQIQPYQ